MSLCVSHKEIRTKKDFGKMLCRNDSKPRYLWYAANWFSTYFVVEIYLSEEGVDYTQSRGCYESEGFDKRILRGDLKEVTFILFMMANFMPQGEQVDSSVWFPRYMICLPAIVMGNSVLTPMDDQEDGGISQWAVIKYQRNCTPTATYVYPNDYDAEDSEGDESD